MPTPGTVEMAPGRSSQSSVAGVSSSHCNFGAYFHSIPGSSALQHLTPWSRGSEVYLVCRPADEGGPQNVRER